MVRRILALCLVALLLGCAATAFADQWDDNRTGTISVTLLDQYEKQPIVGAELAVYHVAAVSRNQAGKLTYTYTRDFENGGIELYDPDLAVKLDAFLSESDIYPLKNITDEEGSVTFTNLALGLYFVKQTSVVEGFAPCTSFLVTVPSQTEDGYVYEVNASPKTQVAKLTTITIKKVWNTDASTNAADSVTVQLLKSGVVIETAVLNAQNNWQVSFPDMPQSDAYTVKEINVPKGFTATYSQKGYEFTVTNTASLAQTGQLIWPIPVLASAGMLLLVAGFVLLQKKRQTNA